MAGSTRNPWEENYSTEGNSEGGGNPWEQTYQEPEKPKDPGILRKAGDLGLSVAKGIVAVPEAAVGLADIPTGGRVGKFLENKGGAFGFRPKQAKEYLASMQSDDLQGKQQQFQQADGIIDKAGVALSNPSLIANAVAESVPLMGAGAVPARAIMAVAPKVGAVAAGAIGEGAVGAGSAAEAIRQETGDGLLTPAQSGLAAATGAATSAFGFAGGKLAQRMGIGDVDTMLTQGAIKTAGAPSAKSIPRQVVEGAIAEGWLEELPQSVSEQVLQNLALNKPWHEGVDDAAVMGTLSGMAMGGAAAGASGFSARGPQPADQQPPTQPPAPAPDAGPTLALPAPDRGVIQVGPDGTARTPAYQAPGYVGDVTDVEPRPIDRVREQVAAAAEQGGALSGAALTAIDSGASSAMQPVAPDAAPPAPISLEEADANDRAAYEQFFASVESDSTVGRYFENDDDIPDFDAASNVSDEDFLRSLGATDEDIQDAIATASQSAIPQSRPAVDAGPQAYEPAGARQGAGTDQAGQEAQVNAAIQPLAAATPVPTLGGSVGDDGAAGTAPAVSDGLSAGGPRNGGAAAAGIGASESGAARPGGRGDGNPALTPFQQARAEIQARKQQEAANAKASQTQAPAAAPVPGAATSAPMEADGRAPDIKAIAAKQIPDMTDVELQQAITHYGPEHKRTAKLQKEAQRRALQPESTPGVNLVPQANQTKQATTQPAQTGAAPAASSDSAAQGAAAGAAPVGSGEPTTELTNAAANQDAGAQGTSVANWKSLTPDQRRRETLEQEIATGKTNNGGVIANLRPSAIEARKQELAAMGERGRLQGPAAPAPRKLPPKLAQKAAQVEAQRADYFTPGNVVPSYGGGHDRVVSYTPGDAQGNWNVRVQAVRQENGAWVNVPREGERIHATQPDARELKAGPVVRAPAAQAAPVEVKQNNAEAQQDKAPAAIINVAENAKRQNAIQRLAEGRVWFLSQNKANAFLSDSGLGDTHEVVQDKRRFVVQEKDAAPAIAMLEPVDSLHNPGKRDQEAVDRASRAGYILGVSNENLPLVKAGNEAKSRLKEGKYEKPEYRVYQGSDTKGPFREITKTEYDYAQELKAQRAAAPQAAESPTLQTAMGDAGWAGETGQGDTIWTKRANGERYTALLSPDAGSMEVTVLVGAVDTQIASFKVGDAKAAAEAANKAVAQDVAEQSPADDALPNGWSKSVNGYTKRPVYRMEQGGGQPFAVVTQVEGMRYEVQIRHGDKQLIVSNQTGALSEVLAKAEAELTRMTQADSVTHQDPGEKAGAATPGVVTDSLKKAARNEDTKPSEMRKWLVAEIDKELLQAADRPDYDEAVKRLGEKDAISGYTGNGPLGKNSETGYITFDVPGDGKYKVRNSVRGLLEFRKNVMASQGFKDSGQKRVKPEQNDGVQGGSGGSMTAIANMIDEGDFEAARDYAEAVGVKLEDVKVPRGDMKPAWEKYLKDGTLPSPPDTKPQPASKTAAQVDEEKRQAAEAEAKKPKDTGWNMAGTGYGGKRYIGRNITLDDGRQVVARIYENAGNYEEAEVKVDGVRKFAVTDRNNAQDKADAFVRTVTGKAAESASSDMTPEEAAKYLKDFVYSLNQLGGMTDRAQVLLSSPLGKSGRDNLLMEAFGLNREQAHDINNRIDARQPKKLRNIDMQDAFDVFPSLRKMVYDAIQQAQAKEQKTPPQAPAIPEGYKPAGEPFYRGGKQIQGYAPFTIGERVTMKASGGQSGVIESLASPDDSGVFASAVVKFDNGMEQMVQFGKLEAEKKTPARVTPQISGNPEKFIKVAADSVADLRKMDVDRVLTETPAQFRSEVAGYIKTRRQDLADEVDDVMAEIQPKAAAPVPAPQPDTPKLTPAEAKSLMAWEDLGQKDGVKTHALTFYESQADKDAKRGRMIVAKVSKGDRSATAWMVDGEDKTFGALAQAKKLAEEVGMAKAVADGFVEQGAAAPKAALDKIAQTIKTKETDKGVAMFSRTGAKSHNAQQPTTRAWYDRFVSLLPASYRNDSHRREPLPAEDWNVQRSAEVREKIDALNKQLRGANDRKGYGPVSADGLGNLQVDARSVSAADLSGPIRALADELGAGVAATNVRSGDVRALLGAGYVSETSLAAIADRLMGRPFAQPVNTYAKDFAPGTILTYKPRGFPAALFARSATPPADSNARNVATQLLVDGLKANWTRAPEIIVARNMQDRQIPQEVRDYDKTLKSQGATGEARGFIYKGKVYLLSDQLKGPQQIAEVLFHEVLGHYGLRGAFGNSLDSILQQIGTMRRKDVVAKAREYGLFDNDALGGLNQNSSSDAQIWDAMSAKDRLSAAEEVLAEMAQSTPEMGFVKRAIAAVRNWLRANMPGFAGFEMTDADIVQAYILPARGFVTRSKETGAQSLERAMLAFSRVPAGDQTETPEFKRWFAGSKVVDSAGKPLVVYHGSERSFAEFDIEEGQRGVGGIWFTDSKNYAYDMSRGGWDSRKRGAGGQIVHAYLDVRNPFEFDVFAEGIKLADDVGVDRPVDSLQAQELLSGGDGWDSFVGNLVEDAKRAGHDALVIKNFNDARMVDSTAYVVFDQKAIAIERIETNDQSAPDTGGAKLSAAEKQDQTQTEAFKRWFKDSKVVDADGKPLVVYHGTRGDISVFDYGRVKSRFQSSEGLYFTARPLHASVYADGVDNAANDFDPTSSFAKPVADGANVMPVYVSLQNPKIISVSEWGTLESAVDGNGGARVRAAKAAGHDGVIVERNAGDAYDGKLVIAFRPEQIKSAIGNNGNFDPANPDIRFSRAAVEGMGSKVGEAIKSVTVANIKQRAGFKATDYLGLGLQALGRRQIVDIYGDMLPLDNYNQLVRQMDADKNEGGAEADQLVTRWAKLPDEGRLADLMHDATLAQIDPAKPYAKGDDKAQYQMLLGRFNALSDEAKQVYADTRNAYQAHHAKVRSAIKERIERSELKGERKKALLEQMDGEFFKAVKGVYFPLARFGQYAVTIKGPDGKVESVSRAETKAEAEALRSNLLEAFPRDKGFAVGRVMLSKDFIADRDAVGRGFMTELYQVLDKQDMDAAQRAELEDTLGQLYLSSLPDLSWAKHGIHRKGTPGFSQDARRAFAQNMFHGARYLAKLRYSDLMQDELSAMQKHVDDWREVEDFDQNKAQRVVDEMNKRHESLMNPQSNALSTALTSFGFVFHLGLSPASALVNLSQTALVAYPIMGAKWGYGKASAALLKASTEAAKGKNDIATSLNADERAAYDEAVRAGTIDVTMAHDLAGIAQGEDAGVMWKVRPVMRWASFLFHHAEKFNRQVTFIASYRLARDAGADQKSAFEQATKATYDGHFDYSSSNRPRIMQGNVARVLLLFKQYGQNMVYTLSRSAYQSIKGTDAEKAEARKVLAGLLTTHAMAAGVLGLPMVTTLLAAASMIGGDDDEPWDAKVALQNMLADTFGQKTAEVLAHGLSRLTPWDISGRVGLDRLIFPDVQEGLEGQRLAESAMTAALGPVAGIGVNLLRGAQMMGDGHYALGLEAMLPSALRGPVKAIRYANEGVQDKSGISIIDQVSPAAVAGQALGFSPSEARNAQEGKSAVMAQDRALGERRQELLTKAARAVMDKDAEALAEARKEIAGFNEKNPGRRITPPNITQSVRSRQKRIDQSQDGVYLPKNRRDAMEAGRFALGG